MAVVWLQETGKLSIFSFIADTQEGASGPIGPVKKACVLLSIQALYTRKQIKFQTYYYLLIIARDFGTLFLWVAHKRVLHERHVALSLPQAMVTYQRGRDYKYKFLNWTFGVQSHHGTKSCAALST